MVIHEAHNGTEAKSTKITIADRLQFAKFHIQQADMNWYNALTAQLTSDQRKELEDVFKLAEQRRAVAESKQIEKRGGYNFSNTSVPQSFNFGSGN